MEFKKNEFCLKIADFSILFYTEIENPVIKLDDSYEPYLISTSANPDYKIKINLGIPKDLQKGEELFKAPKNFENNTEHFWSINKKDNKYYLFTSKHNSIIFPYLVLCFDKNESDWEIYIHATNESETIILEPLIYPMGILILYYVTVLNNGIMIHASGVKFQEHGFLFSGVSGAGKSTMASLWIRKGAKLINDDRLIIRKKEDDFYIYNTPMYYKDEARNCKISKIFLIKHAPKNKAIKLSGANAVTRLMAFCIQQDYDKTFINNFVGSISELLNAIPIYELGFIPDKNITEYILKGEFK